MKKVLTFIMTIAIMISMVLPSQGFALENKELEKAISTSKTLFNITDVYDDFNYGMEKRNNTTVYNLTWRDTKNKLGNINVSIDATGKVWSYSSYKNYDDSKNHSKLPAISKADALKTANAFLQKVNSEVYGKVKYQEDNDIVNIGQTEYNFNYVRMENNIPFYNDNINISVNNRTGEVQNYNSDWTDNLTFPNTSGVITIDKAKQAYKDKLGLKLMYKLGYGSNDEKPYLAYGETYTNRSIDAKTGEVISIPSYYHTLKDKYSLANTASEKAASGGSSLSPEEAKAIEKASNLMNEKKAEETGRKILNIDSSYKLESIQLHNNWVNKGDHTWNMSFIKETTAKDDSYFGASITIDAATGEVISFNKSVPYDNKAAAKYDKIQCINIAKDMLKALNPGKINDVELTEWDDNNIKPLAGAELPKEYTFTFTRKANGVYFPGNGFNISVDAVHGVIPYFNLNWYKGSLPSTDKVIPLEKAHASLFANVGFELQYVADYSKADTGKLLPSGTKVTPDMKLVYAIKPGKPANIDALTGNLLDFSGKPFSEISAKEYTDIKGCIGENEIKVLAQYGITLKGTEFKPNSDITQKDFLYMLAKSVNPYMDSDSDESLYNYLIDSNIIKENEKAPTAAVTRQDAAKFIIRSLKYDNIADIKGIYTLSLKDKDKIDQKLLGYVAIAYGLNIIKDDNGFVKPTDKLTRSGAAIILYNLLNAQ